MSGFRIEHAGTLPTQSCRQPALPIIDVWAFFTIDYEVASGPGSSRAYPKSTRILLWRLHPDISESIIT
jgi:hypothetical protein